MNVTIYYRNNFEGGDGWTCYPLTLDISNRCPVCGGLRGKPKPYTFHEDGENITVDQWQNPCGHVDQYRACFFEAQRLRKLRGFTGEAVILKVVTQAERRGAWEFTYLQGKQTQRRKLSGAEWVELALMERERLEDLEGREVLDLGDAELTEGLGDHSYFYLKPLTVNDLIK